MLACRLFVSSFANFIVSTCLLVYNIDVKHSNGLLHETHSFRDEPLNSRLRNWRQETRYIVLVW